MKNNYKDLYYLHIPKSGGRSFKINIIEPIINLLIKNKINLIKNTNPDYEGLGHNQWTNEITDSTYIVSTFRDPARHMVSLYAHHITLDIHGELIDGSEPLNKESFLEWIKINKKYVMNYQSRHIVSETSSGNYFSENLALVTNLDIDLVLKNIKRINMFLKLENITFNNISTIQKRILKDLNIDMYHVDDIDQPIEIFNNDYSKDLYDLLTDDEINDLYSISPVDFAIHNNKSLFYNNI